MTVPKDTPNVVKCATSDTTGWYGVVVAVTISLAISAFVLSLHSAFPHKDAAHKGEVLMVHDQMRDLRQDIKDLTSEMVRLREALLNNKGG